MESRATRFGERNLARPGLRRTTADIKSVVNKDNVLKPVLKQTSSNVLAPSKTYETRLKKATTLKPAGCPAKKTERATKQDVVDDITSKLNNISVEDIDAEDKENPLLASEYITDIYAYMRKMEITYHVGSSYMEGKRDITERMRTILVDWLVQVHLKFKLLQETLYLTVAILDRFLSVSNIKRNKLQLVGVTSMLIASKFEEIYAPEVNDFVFITDTAYSYQEILDMEIEILNTLQFDINHPLPLHFLRRASKAGKADGRVHTLGKYLCELALISLPMLRFKPSEIAAGAFLVAQHVLLPKKQWGSTLTHYTGYSREAALVPAKAISELVIRAEKSKHQAVRNKYGSSKFMSVSSLDALDNVHDLLSE